MKKINNETQTIQNLLIYVYIIIIHILKKSDTHINSL